MTQRPCVSLSRITIRNSDTLDDYSFVSLSDLMVSFEEEKVRKALESFEPYKDGESVQFLREKAIPMEKRDLSRTYLALASDKKTILGFVTVGMKCLLIPKENLLTRSELKDMNIDSKSGVAQAYLFGQLARSKKAPNGFGIDLIDFALTIFRNSKKNVGCHMVRLDCTDELIDYYEKHGFRLIRKNEDGDLNQMMIFI